MAAGAVHFEIFFKKNRKDAWRLLEATPDRAAALTRAQELIKTHPEGSARVAKETFDEANGTFQSLTVFEAGGERYEDSGRADRKAELPCRGPSDLVQPHARHAISRALRSWLARHVSVSLELLHRVDLVEKLEASDVEMQHAVQKIAIAQASNADASAQHFVKQINALVQQAVERLYAEARAGDTPKLKANELAVFAQTLRDAADRDRRMRAAIAVNLKGAKTWKAKLERLLDLAEAAEAGCGEAAWVQDLVGEFVGEVVEMEPARAALLDCPPALGDRLNALTELCRGSAAAGAGLSAAGERLAALFAADRFRDARTGLARRIIAELKSPRRLLPDDFAREVALNRSLADRLVALAGPMIGPEEIGEAFVLRSSRLLEPEAIDGLLADAADPCAGLTEMIRLEDNIVGDHNKRKLASYVRARFGAHPVERWFVHSKGGALRRMAELATLRRLAAGSGFAERDRTEIAERIDALAEAAEAAAKLFDTIEARAMPPLDMAATFLRLAAKGALPEGRMVEEARRRAGRILSGAAARKALSSGEPQAAARAQEIAQLLAALTRAGESEAA